MKMILALVLATSAWAFETPVPRVPTPRVPPPAVRHGDKVEVTVNVGNVEISFEAEAESSGHPGETVIVRNPENGRRFVARVLEAGKVGVKK